MREQRKPRCPAVRPRHRLQFQRTLRPASRSTTPRRSWRSSARPPRRRAATRPARRAGHHQRPGDHGSGLPAGILGANTRPISNSRRSADPWRTLRPAAASRPGSSVPRRTAPSSGERILERHAAARRFRLHQRDAAGLRESQRRPAAGAGPSGNHRRRSAGDDGANRAADPARHAVQTVHARDLFDQVDLARAGPRRYEGTRQSVSRPRSRRHRDLSPSRPKPVRISFDPFAVDVRRRAPADSAPAATARARRRLVVAVVPRIACVCATPRDCRRRRFAAGGLPPAATPPARPPGPRRARNGSSRRCSGRVRARCAGCPPG